MIKRVIALLLVLCCAFCFICRPVSAAATTALLTAGGIAELILSAFGIIMVADVTYNAFGEQLHDIVTSVSDAGSKWWDAAVMGNIELNDADPRIKESIYTLARQAADAIPQSGQDVSTYTFTLSSYVTDPYGTPIQVYDYRNKSYTFTSGYHYPIFCIEATCVTTDGKKICPYVNFISAKPFKHSSGSTANASGNLYIWTLLNKPPLELGEKDRFHGFKINFNSSSELSSYVDYLLSLSSSSSAGGATAVYPIYGYDGVKLPNINLTQAGLAGDDVNTTVSDLVGQLRSGAITWEDYIGTVAPGQTATITLTDADGASATYTLTNAGIGERVQAGTGTGTGSETDEEDKPIVGELSGTLANTEAKTFLESLIDAISKPFATVAEKVEAIPATIAETISSIFVPSTDFLTAKVDALRERFSFADSIIDTGEAVRDALNGFGSGPPIIYAELSNSRGKYDWGDRAIALDLTWYEEYKPTVDAIISSFLWLMFAWKVFVKLSGIINGAGSNVEYVIQHEKDIAKNEKGVKK